MKNKHLIIVSLSLYLNICMSNVLLNSLEPTKRVSNEVYRREINKNMDTVSDNEAKKDIENAAIAAQTNPNIRTDAEKDNLEKVGVKKDASLKDVYKKTEDIKKEGPVKKPQKSTSKKESTDVKKSSKDLKGKKSKDESSNGKYNNYKYGDYQYYDKKENKYTKNDKKKTKKKNLKIFTRQELYDHITKIIVILKNNNLFTSDLRDKVAVILYKYKKILDSGKKFSILLLNSEIKETSKIAKNIIDNYDFNKDQLSEITVTTDFKNHKKGWNQNAKGQWIWFTGYKQNLSSSVGWQYYHKKLMYENIDQTYATNSWIKDSNKFYHFNSRGYVDKGWKFINQNWYYFNDLGVMQKNWKKINNIWYQFSNNGILYTDNNWKQVNGHWMYSNGKKGYLTSTKWKKYKFNSYGYLK